MCGAAAIQGGSYQLPVYWPVGRPKVTGSERGLGRPGRNPASKRGRRAVSPSSGPKECSQRSIRTHRLTQPCALQPVDASRCGPRLETLTAAWGLRLMVSFLFFFLKSCITHGLLSRPYLASWLASWSWRLKGTCREKNRYQSWSVCWEHSFPNVCVQLSSCIQLLEILCTAAHQASLSLIISQSLLKFMSIESWHHPTISSSVVLFSSCLQSFPAIQYFPVSQFFASGGQSTGASALASVLQWIFRIDFL